ncbi:hypothetical protein C0992_007713 [Termitomyces sp. T32_za158]|nr:hypothetical protein C0992_007713 [Termitomyces sp. T32_za158]
MFSFFCGLLSLTYFISGGGDTEVDVNDVEYALQKVIPARKAEDTWVVDCYGGIPAKIRAPDEAIVLCLDLSSSMDESSAVESGAAPFNHAAEGEKSVDEAVKDYAEGFILQRAEEWISNQHESCHEAWKSLIEREITLGQLIEHLSLIAQRQVLTFMLRNHEQLHPELFESSFDTSVSLVLGLVTFADKALVKQELTPVFENFRVELDKVEARGDTAMYEALELARRCLINFRCDLPGLRRRIVVISDGEDTSVGIDPMQVGRALQKDSIVVDSVQVGSFFSNSLWAFSAATGTSCIKKKDAFPYGIKAAIDLETMMNSAERPQRTRLMRAFSFASRELLTAPSLTFYPIDTVTIDQFPKRKEHPKLTEGVTDVRRATTNTDALGLKNDRTKRVMREVASTISTHFFSLF